MNWGGSDNAGGRESREWEMEKGSYGGAGGFSGWGWGCGLRNGGRGGRPGVREGSPGESGLWLILR